MSDQLHLKRNDLGWLPTYSRTLGRWVIPEALRVNSRSQSQHGIWCGYVEVGSAKY